MSTIARSSSTRQPSYSSSSDRPPRSQSASNRPSSTAVASRSSTQNPPSSRPPSGSQRAAAETVARRDFEQSNVAKPPTTSRRSSSHDHAAAPSPARADSHRRSARGGPQQHDSRDTNPPAHVHMDAATRSMAAATGAQPRRRTTITSDTGTWALGKTLGAGSMGKVKFAKNIETGEQVAVKIIPRVSTDEHRTQAERERADHSKEIRTAREAAIVSLVNHPYICGMRDYVKTNYHWYMMFEYVNGGQMLDYIINHGRLKEKQARKFGRQIASALDYCHRNSIVHRDLKIENILISKTGDIKIIDFGLSNLFSPTGHLKTFCGSLYFAAPELLQARQYTGPEVDIWSFGIVLYVLVCGKVPFDDQSMPQLHAKIKKGHVDYPPWLSPECKNLISRMLVTDPKQRASLHEILNHVWLTKGFNAPPENFLPHREPLQLPLDMEVVKRMQGFDFGSTDYIASKLTSVLESEDYQRAVRAAARRSIGQTPENEKKRGVFDFYRRRNSTTSRDQLSIPSSEAVMFGSDPVNAYHPLISIYFLQREKMERERAEANPGALGHQTQPETEVLRMPDAPAAAYTNSARPEMAGEKPTGGRTRPRARTNGEEEIREGVNQMQLNAPAGAASPGIVTQPAEPTPAKKESVAGGILRRLSTRKTRERPPEREPKDRSRPPQVMVNAPPDNHSPGPVRRSFSVRRNRSRDQPSSSSLQATSQAQQDNLLTPLLAGEGFGRKFRGLGRSTSVNSAEMRRRVGRRTTADGSAPGQDVPATSGSDGSSVAAQSGTSKAGDAAAEFGGSQQQVGSPSSRTKSLSHARQESIQTRRLQRRSSRRDFQRNDPSSAQDESEPAFSAGRRGTHRYATDKDDGAVSGAESMKPVYLKGLFSVSTTSSRPLPEIRSEITRVLRKLGVSYTEIKGGFACRHAPSISLKEKDPAIGDAVSPRSADFHSPVTLDHRRRISFGMSSLGKERDEFRQGLHSPNTPTTPQTTGSTRRNRHAGSSSNHNTRETDQPQAYSFSNTNTDDSDSSDRENAAPHPGAPRPRPAGETTTHVRDDVSNSMVLRFDIFIVKVPLLSLYGIQFKKIEGNIMGYKNMAQEILKGLRL